MLCIDPMVHTGDVCGSPDPTLLADLQLRPQSSMLDMGYLFHPENISQQPPSYYEPQWSETSIFTPSPLSVDSAASVEMVNSSPSPYISGTDYTFCYDPNNYGALNSQMSSLRDAGDMHTYMTPTPMTSFPTYSFA